MPLLLYPFFRPLSPHSPCTRGISRSGAPCHPQPPHGPDVRNNLSGKLHLQSRNPASDPHWKKEALLYVPEWKADRESALQALPDPALIPALISVFSSSVKESFNCHKITCFTIFLLISAHAFCACRVCVKCAQTQISRLKKFYFSIFLPLCFFSNNSIFIELYPFFLFLYTI